MPLKFDNGVIARLGRHPYAVAALAAFAVRLAIIFVRRTYNFPPGDPFFFGMETGSIARALASGEGFSSPFRGSTGATAWIAPVYPALCAVIFKMLGVFTAASAIAILIINSVFSALTCFPMGAIARRTVGQRAGVLAAFTWALLPHFAKWPTEWVWDMALSGLLAATAIWLTLLLAERATAAHWLWFGVLWAAITLSNPSLLTLLPFSAVWLIARRRGPGFWRGAAIAVIACFVLVAPWLVRNRLALGRWVFVRDNFGFELHLGNFHGSNGMGWSGMHPATNPAVLALYRRLGEVEFVRESGEAARKFIRENPGEFARLCVTRFVAFWDGASLGYSPEPWPWTPASFLAVSLIAFAGLLWATLKRVRAVGLYWWIVLYPLPYYITYAGARYRHAAEPEMLLLGGYVLVAAVEAALGRRAKSTGSAVA